MKMNMPPTTEREPINKPRIATRQSFDLVRNLLLCATVLAVTAATAQTNPPPASYLADRILVKPNPGADLTSLNASLGTTVLRSFPRIGNLQVIQLPQNASVTNYIAQYQQSGSVQYAEPDWIVHAADTTPNDARFGEQWSLHNTGQSGGTHGADVHARPAWDIRTSAANIIVADTDTGARLTHEDLAPNLWVNRGEIPGNTFDDDGDGYVDDVHGINAITGSGDPTDDNGHGTHTAGTFGAAGNNGLGIAGVSWNVQLMPLKFLDSIGFGSDSGAIACIDYANSHNANVINASWGGSSFSQALHDAIASLRDAGIIFVAAAGNRAPFDNDVNPFYPASFTDLDNIVAVAATDDYDNLADFSHFGAQSVHLGAPGGSLSRGVEILSCWIGSDSDYQLDLGTSMATPHVTGAFALTWAQFPNDFYRQIIKRVVSAVDPRPSLAGITKTGGRLNLLRALVPNGDGNWTATAPLNGATDSHTATLLPDGTVLVAGGYKSGTGEIADSKLYTYNAVSGVGTWTATFNTLITRREWHTDTLLRDGSVLVAAGFNSTDGTLASCERYQRDTDGVWKWMSTGRLIEPRYGHTATLLNDGTVLVTGGFDGNGGYHAGAEKYDPLTGTWSALQPMNVNRGYHTATLLPDGRVLVAGGYNYNYLNSAEIYDPSANTWTLTPPMNDSRVAHSATLLANGQVLVAGGFKLFTENSSAELYDPNSNTWTPTDSMQTARDSHTATLLSNGKVLVVGGAYGSDTAEVYDPAAPNNRWSYTSPMNYTHYGHTATYLAAGRVLVVAGEGTSSAELYNPVRF